MKHGRRLGGAVVTTGWWGAVGGVNRVGLGGSVMVREFRGGGSRGGAIWWSVILARDNEKGSTGGQ